MSGCPLAEALLVRLTTSKGADAFPHLPPTGWHGKAACAGCGLLQLKLRCRDKVWECRLYDQGWARQAWTVHTVASFNADRVLPCSFARGNLGSQPGLVLRLCAAWQSVQMHHARCHRKRSPCEAYAHRVATSKAVTHAELESADLIAGNASPGFTLTTARFAATKSDKWLCKTAKAWPWNSKNISL